MLNILMFKQIERSDKKFFGVRQVVSFSLPREEINVQTASGSNRIENNMYELFTHTVHRTYTISLYIRHMENFFFSN